ncbi:serine-threonine protein kinase, putative [Entamoeba invadens IP1]|uniref:Serine-threonine protein kinase, putative n=1 Tax=Entamoeba invadens IP1 TaxID=370355 RepID=A0A0A1U469_ENTIV|nr:serine-threonine protein kinase, putative [Entamoeba invadens IP1]ELP87508.1 serine-threonine protein kinase, putative [Entamoeba invadens IP1]|eukprot:XP_004254279.1 serine-threonine protein kinase, putative [Entamoeba invadens IP1]
MFIILSLLILNFARSEQIKSDPLCSPGCSSNCMADYTCTKDCTENYDNDGACTTCKVPQKGENNLTVFIKQDDVCYKFTNKETSQVGNSWLPQEDDITELNLDSPITFKIDGKCYFDFSFCYYPQKYRLGRWFKINMTQFTMDHFNVFLTKPRNDPVAFYFDGTHSQRDMKSAKCLVHSSLPETMFENVLKFPVFSPYKGVVGRENDSYFDYFFVSIDGTKEVIVEMEIKEEQGKQLVPKITIEQADADRLITNLSEVMEIHINFESENFFAYPACMPGIFMKIYVFHIKYIGNYYLLFDSRENNRVNLMSEYVTVTEKNGSKHNDCVFLWEGKIFSEYNEGVDKEGFLVRINGTVDRERQFLIATEDRRGNFTVKVRGICPENCNMDKGWGLCSSYNASCMCNDAYGGDNCHEKCYYKNKWTVTEYSNLCYFGVVNCDQYCKCTSGSTFKDHLCYSTECLNGQLGPLDECHRGTEGCYDNCGCMNNIGFFPNEKHECIHEMCGNDEIDEYFDADGTLIRKEECDGGPNCLENCRCEEGYVPDKESELGCVKKQLGGGAIAGIVIGGVVFFVILVIILVIIIVFGLEYKKQDINRFKTQQPRYHYYISGSMNLPGGKGEKYEITPTTLNFGNETEATNIFETRFERMEVKNNSRNKYMMVIFHTPFTPKYTFYFDPQVAILKPRTLAKEVTTYMTLQCSCKIRGMKIPYTVWFSKKITVLREIEAVLKDKTFEEWMPSDQVKIENLCKHVDCRMHGSIIIATDSMSSTHIDMDELNMSETPIAEGAMGKVFVGNYRSVPVAVKQFRWENLDDQEFQELKHEVTQECDMMSKLRNPFIANYIGSVTYIPQISMVIQFFVLGSLGEYLREENDDFIRLPYRLKVRMLYDTAKGMQFLHENRIMHLDLKPDNLLVNSLDTESACTIKITDFGTSRFTKKKLKNNDAEYKGLGTPIYAAPETFVDVYTFAGDVYSFGITAWEVFYQEEPYKTFKSIFDIKKFVENGERLSLDRGIPQEYAEVIAECWRQNYSDRPDFDKITRSLVNVETKSHGFFDFDSQVDEERIAEVIGNKTERLKRFLAE